MLFVLFQVLTRSLAGVLDSSLSRKQPDELDTTLSTLISKAMNDQPIQPGEGVLRHAEGVDLIPANIELAGLEVALVNSMNREKMLKQVLDSAKREYDYILLDCIHIINYAKTRPVYDAYRKSGYPRSTASFHFVRVQTAQHATPAIVP